MPQEAAAPPIGDSGDDAEQAADWVPEDEPDDSNAAAPPTRN